MTNASALVDMMVNECGSELREFADGDFQNADGLMVCGVCRRPLQQRIIIPVEGYGIRVVRIQCECEKATAERKKQERQWQEDKETIASLRRASLMDSKLEDSTFDKYQVKDINSKQYKICKRYADGFEEMLASNQGMILWGDTGTGKSFSAAVRFLWCETCKY